MIKCQEKDSFTRTIKVTVYLYRLKWVQCNSKALFTCNVKKIKGAANKNGDIDGMCKRTLRKTKTIK